MNFENLKQSLNEGLVFHKPNVNSTILKIDENGISYSIGKNGRSKKVSFEIMEEAYNELMDNGILKREWFIVNYPLQAKNSPCNFTTIGGLLQHFDLAIYKKGLYIKNRK